MPIGGKLVLKGGVTLGKKKKKKKPATDEALAAELAEADAHNQDTTADTQQQHDPSKPKPLAPTAISVTGKTYEEEFIYETQRTQVCMGDDDVCEKRIAICCAQ